MKDNNEQNEFSHNKGPECFDDGSGIEPEITESEDKITEPFDPTLIRVETKPLSMDLCLVPMLQHRNDKREIKLSLVPWLCLGTSGNLWKRLSSCGSLDRGRKAAPT